MALSEPQYYFVLMLAAGALCFVYTTLVFKLIIAKCSIFDRFTLSLTVFGLLGTFLFAGSTIAAYVISKHNITE